MNDRARRALDERQHDSLGTMSEQATLDMECDRCERQTLLRRFPDPDSEEILLLCAVCYDKLAPR